MLNAQSLKTVIAINIFLLLLIVVVLIDFVFVSTSQKDYIAEKTKDSRMLTLSVEKALYTFNEMPAQPLPSASERYLKDINFINDISSMVIIGPTGSQLFTNDTVKDKKLDTILISGATEAALSGKSRTYLYGKIWGVFFVRSHYLIVSSPILFRGTDKSGAVSSAINLAPFYTQQKKNQLIILFYSIINILLLMILGTYAVSRATIRPINNLVKRAEEHHEDDTLGLFYAPGKNEFRRLSNSLNRMLDRIEGDKRRLETSLVRLEEANREIKDRQNELIRAEKLASVGRLSAGIAHEIGNPIGIVLGYLDLLNNHQDLTEKEKTDYIARCQSEIQKISSIIRELLDFSRPSGKGGKEAVAVHDLIKETMDLLSVQPVMRDIFKKYEFTAVNDIVSAVPDKLRQVFVNLILNAADAIGANPSANGEITIRSSATAIYNEKAAMLCIDISDNGVGINAENLETIFDPFYTTKDPGQGTGLGLYVCYMIIDNIGGTIDVSSTPGEGTTFSIHFPLLNHETKEKRVAQ